MWIYITHVTGLKIFKIENTKISKLQDLVKMSYPRSYQEIQDVKTISFHDIQEFKIFLRSRQDIQDVERWLFQA